MGRGESRQEVRDKVTGHGWGPCRWKKQILDRFYYYYYYYYLMIFICQQKDRLYHITRAHTSNKFFCNELEKKNVYINKKYIYVYNVNIEI